MSDSEETMQVGEVELIELIISDPQADEVMNWLGWMVGMEHYVPKVLMDIGNALIKRQDERDNAAYGKTVTRLNDAKPHVRYS